MEKLSTEIENPPEDFCSLAAENLSAELPFGELKETVSNGNSKPCPRTVLSASSSVGIFPVLVKGGPKKEDNCGEEEADAGGRSTRSWK